MSVLLYVKANRFLYTYNNRIAQMVQQLERSYAIIHYTISVRIPCLLTDLKHNVLQIVKKLNKF